ncbi:hypothetical protein CALCODRAFT_163927 [Calocera cornea HHB12733]|uniref:Uncharacterized protein n=1 Tax=Calocera cornea HHB12733 TaxID=1353952 RepID=A0A165CIY2_9BASI|nr:hypothetical protein CALCODRAFT_163927 [Calocera cornea HHB12733]
MCPHGFKKVGARRTVFVYMLLDIAGQTGAALVTTCAMTTARHKVLVEDIHLLRQAWGCRSTKSRHSCSLLTVTYSHVTLNSCACVELP